MCFKIVLILLQTCFLLHWGSAESHIKPEFTEPIKNITISEGSNVEFSCYIKHLGGYRIMWLKKDEEKETFVAINLLKITKNPRITVTLLQSSDDVTQSNVYIHNADKADTAIYVCAVNTNPMISQIGSLDVTTSSDKAGPFTPDVPEPTPSMDVEVPLKPKNETVPIINEGTSNQTEELIEEDFLQDKNSSFEIGDESRNGTLCSGMKTFWEEATDSIKEMVKNVLDSLVNFTCSFLTPNN